MRQAVFVDHATGVSASSDAVLIEIDLFGQRFQRRGAVQGAVRPVLIVVDSYSRRIRHQLTLPGSKIRPHVLTLASTRPAGIR
jgi:hypothetical protein